MKLSYEWLSSFFDEKLPAPAELAELIERHAFEVEEIEVDPSTSLGASGDTVLDINITPNRAHDALSVRGIAKEVSAITKLPLADDPLRKHDPLTPESNRLSVSVDDPTKCPCYAAAVIEGVSVNESPEWLKRRLESMGQRSINNVVDATNYVMFHLGQPLHAFDASKMGQPLSIRVRQAKDGESFTALDGKTYELSAADTVIGDATSGEALGIAGVKGGKAAEINEKTTTIVLESANFDPISIRKTSKRLKLRTDASVRFENGLSPELTGFALSAVVKLILELAGGTVEGYVDIYAPTPKHPPISVTLAQTNSVLGSTISAEEAADIFTRLGLPFVQDGETFTVTPPFERLDLAIPEDLIEEIGRIYGLDRIVAVIPEQQQASEINKRFYWSEKIREVLIGLGFSEIYTSSFRDKDAVELANALASDKGFLRSSLVSNMEAALALNAYNAPLLGLAEARIFEIGTVFEKDGEHFSLALGVSGKGAKTLSLAEEKLSEAIGITVKGKAKGGVLELDLDALIEKLPQPDSYDPVEKLPDVPYKAFSPYPFIVRDIAMWVPSGFAEGGLRDLFDSIVTTNLSPNIFARTDFLDRYEKEGKVSIAFRLVFQAFDRTLTDEETNGIVEKISEALKTKGFDIR